MRYREIMEAKTDLLYHVTFASRVPSIQKNGIISGKHRNWDRAFGGKYGERGLIYLFTTAESAVRWAFKMQYEFSRPTVIIELANVSGDLNDDPSGESQLMMNGAGTWKTIDTNIPPSCIHRIIPMTPPLAKKLVAITAGKETSLVLESVNRPTRNSNGQPLAQTEEGLRNFWAWFGDSKVIDKEGCPLVVYHGTSADFEAFEHRYTGKHDRGLWGRGHYFSAFPCAPNSYAERQGCGARVIPAYISMKNPLVLQTGSDRIIRLPDGTNSRDLIGPNLDGAKIKDMALEAGNDGVLQVLPNGNIGDLVVYSPSQIKSVHNRGTFDPADARIMESF